MTLIAAAASPAVAAAAPAAAPGEPLATAPLRSILSLAIEGGVMMVPIGICSLVALAVTVERMFVLRRGLVIPPAFAADVRRALQAPASARSMIAELCARTDAPASRVIAAGLRRLPGPIDLAEKHVEDTGRREAATLRRRTRALAVTASVAPLLGLLGTILGMITAFRTVAASADALGRTEMLAEGIYEAMITTAAGLVVAIPALLAHHALQSRIARLVMEMDALSVDVLEGLYDGDRAVGDASTREGHDQVASVEPVESAAPVRSAARPASAEGGGRAGGAAGRGEAGGGAALTATAAASPAASAAEAAS